MNSTIAATSPAPSRQTAPVYLPGLNGLRAIAALAVVVSHITLVLPQVGLRDTILGGSGGEKGIMLAGHGVTIFFALSGFLITFLLLKEKEVAPVRIKDFYIRRILRIWPLYYLYLALAVLTLVLYNIPFSGVSVAFYIFLAANIPFILNNSLGVVGHHYWSLGVEEQFYLFFPHLARFTNRNLFKIVIVLIGLLLFVKFICWILFNKYGMELPLRAITVTRFHVMLMGVAAAILYYNRHRLFIAITTHMITQVIAWGVIVLLAINKFHIASIIDGELVAVVAICLIMGQITKRSFVNLENKVCDFLGKISYGIYVIHPLLIFYFSKIAGTMNDSLFSYVAVFGVILGSTITIAWISYEFYEKKFLKLKAKFSTVKSVSSLSAKPH